jgi:integrase
VTGAVVGKVPSGQHQQGSDRNDLNAQQTGALSSLLDAAGLDASDLLTAIQVLADAKKQTAARSDEKKSIYLDKELVVEWDDAFVFRRGDTKSQTYYLRMYDKKRKKPYVKSLGERDRIKALTKARLIYQELLGKIDRGEKLQSITSKELVDRYIAKLENIVTDVPKMGITPETLRVKKYFLRMWLEFIEVGGYKNTSIDQIPSDKTREFGMYMLNLPKEDGGKRSSEHINKIITEVKRMYKEIAVRERFLGSDQVPELDLLRVNPNIEIKDILSLEQYDKLWKWMYYKWIPAKGITPLEKSKRIIFYNAIGILYNTGLRPKELLGLRLNEISQNEADPPELQKTHRLIKVREDNSKTGKSRLVNAPVKKRIDRILAAYKEIGIIHKPTDFLLFNPSTEDKKQYTRQSLDHRLQQVLKQSGLKEELELEGKKISLYSSRHAYITWRLRHGNVPIHLVAAAAGTSIKMIELRYGHIQVEKQTELLTRNQGYAAAAEVDLGLSVAE